MRMLARTKVEPVVPLNLPFDILRKGNCKAENHVPEKVSEFPDEYVKTGRM